MTFRTDEELTQPIKVKFTLESGNSKTGPIPVSISSSNTCPRSCPWFGQGCYAEAFPLSLHWKAASEQGMDWKGFCHMVKALPENQIWRHNAAGDLPGLDGEIDLKMLQLLTKANRGKRGFTFTHKHPTAKNIKAVKQANQHGFTVNWSADSPEQADALADLNAGPVAITLPLDSPNHQKTPAGRHIILCPATTHEEITCQSCGLCAVTQRKAIVGFPVHGAKKKRMHLQLISNL